VLRALSILSFLTRSSSLCLAKSTSYEAPHYVAFSNLLLFHLPSVQIISASHTSSFIGVMSLHSQ
jgi:hypothetical protein